MRRSRQPRKYTMSIRNGLAEIHPVERPRSQPWGVYLHGNLIDTVFYNPDLDKDYVKDGLVNHDGYDPGITVRRRKL